MSQLHLVGQKISLIVNDLNSCLCSIRSMQVKVNESIRLIVYLASDSGRIASLGLINDLNQTLRILKKAEEELLATRIVGQAWLESKIGVKSSVNGNVMSFTQSRPDATNYSIPYSTLTSELGARNVVHNPITIHKNERSEDEIIKDIAGKDNTGGSCSSLALTYAACKAGFDVHDRRGGESMNVFSNPKTIDELIKLPGVIASKEEGFSYTLNSNRLFEKMEDGKQYYFATAQHAAVIQKFGDDIAYLELQEPYDAWNGWYELNDTSLKERFHERFSFNYPSYLIDIDSLVQSQEFMDLMGYINTTS